MINPVFYKRENSDLYITPKDYGQFLCDLFDLWINKKENVISIEPFKSIMFSMLTGKTRICHFSGSCGTNHYVVDSIGDLYLCGRWNKKETLFGNINRQSLNEIFNSIKVRNFKLKLKNRLYLCNKCKYYSICNGGCSYIGYYYTESYTKDFYCEAYYSIFDHIFNQLEQLRQ